jgi:hypothetical protein
MSYKSHTALDVVLPMVGLLQLPGLLLLLLLLLLLVVCVMLLLLLLLVELSVILFS